MKNRYHFFLILHVRSFSHIFLKRFFSLSIFVKKMGVTSCSAQKRSQRREGRTTAVMCKAQVAQMSKTAEVEEPTKLPARRAHDIHSLPPQTVQVLCKRSVCKALHWAETKC